MKRLASALSPALALSFAAFGATAQTALPGIDLHNDVIFDFSSVPAMVAVQGRVASGSGGVDYVGTGTAALSGHFGGVLTTDAARVQDFEHMRIDFYFADESGAHNAFDATLKSDLAKVSFDLLGVPQNPQLLMKDFPVQGSSPAPDSVIGRVYAADGSSPLLAVSGSDGLTTYSASMTMQQHARFSVDWLAVALTFQDTLTMDTLSQTVLIHGPDSSEDSCGAKSPDYSCVWDSFALPHPGRWKVTGQISVGQSSAQTWLDVDGQGLLKLGPVTLVDAHFADSSAHAAPNVVWLPAGRDANLHFEVLAVAVPEPPAWVLAATGLLVVGSLARRRARL